MRLCSWCDEGIRTTARRDARFCSQSCRQASHRFHAGAVRRVAASSRRRMAYADPPYPGKSGLYRGHPDFGGEVDHRELVEQLATDFPDGWALSTSSEALQDVLAVAPAGVSVAAWFRGERPTPSYSPLRAWEPVVVWGGRKYLSPVDERRVDALVHVSRARLTDRARVIGAKPGEFCWWLFDLLGALPGDELVDLFPGSGGVARAWRYLSSAAVGDASWAAGPDASGCSPSDVSSLEGRRVVLGSRTDLSLVARADAS